MDGLKAKFEILAANDPPLLSFFHKNLEIERGNLSPDELLVYEPFLLLCACVMLPSELQTEKQSFFSDVLGRPLPDAHGCLHTTYDCLRVLGLMVSLQEVEAVFVDKDYPMEYACVFRSSTGFNVAELKTDPISEAPPPHFLEVLSAVSNCFFWVCLEINSLHSAFEPQRVVPFSLGCKSQKFLHFAGCFFTHFCLY